MDTVRIIDRVNGTSSNDDGHRLFLVVDAYIQRHEEFALSFADMHPMSSSFLNSSFGEIVRKYGFGILKKYVKLTDFRQSDVKRLSGYLKTLQLEETVA
ncbi:STAS-like domain-containing protein [Neolewinella sp.]|uniref:STAS-like domain-containing protein n=1 Tax=Neolewinella sp. TaxID=2993543 RepID=UPI003B527658